MLAFAFTNIAIDHARRGGFMPDEMLGSVPEMLSILNPLGAVDQIDAAYRPVGGGWRDSTGHRLDLEAGTLTYPGDQPRRLVAEASLRDERILFFNGAWVVVIQPDHSYRVARID